MSDRRSDRGFSLIELLITLMVIVLLTSLTSLNVGSGSADLRREQEVQHLASMMTYALTEAEYAGADYGLYLELEPATEGDRYLGHWLRRYDQGWAEPPQAGDTWKAIEFAPGSELLVELEGAGLLELTTSDPELRPVPQIVFLASGEASPGQIDWLEPRTGALLYTLQWDLFGRATLLPRGVAMLDDN